MPGVYVRYFNTSHVSINHKGQGDRGKWLIYFNTSHVSINPLDLDVKERSAKISIHLMFLLIADVITCSLSGDHFNTSHVSINRKIFCRKRIFNKISIHLMFLLIRNQVKCWKM